MSKKDEVQRITFPGDPEDETQKRHAREQAAIAAEKKRREAEAELPTTNLEEK